MSGDHDHHHDGVDPAPSAPEKDEEALAARLLNIDLPMFERMRGLFSLRDLGTDAAIDAMARCLRTDGSALLRHEIAFVFGQMQDPRTIDPLADSLFNDPNPMVRHEAAESLGNMPRESRDTCKSLLKKSLSSDPSVEVRESAEMSIMNLDFLSADEEFDY